ncbi:MAG: 7-carboxy-7-deazaguanine synthase QueE [Phycisphaerales bacterium]|nr:7-carboxy-7-deazaguanine synthase QueE [Phycisphaerales bacterium]
MTLPIMEYFYSLQGEGYFQGSAAYFIRLAGCDVGCVWCDVKDSWHADNHPQLSIDIIIENLLHDVRIHNIKTEGLKVIITGGEPLQYQLNELTNALHYIGCKVHLETSGAYHLSGTFDWICVSPKKMKAPVDSILMQAHELKVVIYNQDDFNWATKYASLMNPSCLLYLQPEWGKSNSMTPIIIDYIKKNPRWQLSLQIHNFLKIR